MTKLEQSIEFQKEECIRFQVYIPPLVMPDGRKLKLADSSGHIQGQLPPIKFLVPDPDNSALIGATFFPMEMRWELDG